MCHYVHALVGFNNTDLLDHEHSHGAMEPFPDHYHYLNHLTPYIDYLNQANPSTFPHLTFSFFLFFVTESLLYG